MKKEFSFFAKDVNGNHIHGQINAVSEKEAESELISKYYKDIRFEFPESNKTKKKKIKQREELLLKYTYRVKTKDLLFAFVQIETFLKAGVTLTSAIDFISQSHPNKRLKVIFSNVSKNLKAGQELSVCFSKYPDVFDSLVVNLIKTGEMSGNSELVFNKLAIYLEKMNSLKSSLSSAMIYPKFLFVFMFVIVGFMLWKIIPTFENMYQDTGGDFPAITRFVLNMSDYVIHNYIVIILVMILISLLLKLFKKYKSTRTIMDIIKINVFVLGPIIRLIAISRIMSTISMMLNSGISIVLAMRTAGKTSGNEIYSKAMNQIANDISVGKDVSKSFKRTKLFPIVVSSFMETAEQSGTIDEMTEKISEYFESESNYKIKEFSSIIEPLLLIVLGTVTALLVVSIYLPIMTFGETFQQY